MAANAEVLEFLPERIGHARRGGKPEFKLERYPPSYEPACSADVFLNGLISADCPCFLR